MLLLLLASSLSLLKGRGVPRPGSIQRGDWSRFGSVTSTLTVERCPNPFNRLKYLQLFNPQLLR
ncbi:MAG TPA: hypothetical protein V6D43_26090, partial [Candidatus Sericytochromatia bacterium]